MKTLAIIALLIATVTPAFAQFGPNQPFQMRPQGLPPPSYPIQQYPQQGVPTYQPPSLNDQTNQSYTFPGGRQMNCVTQRMGTYTNTMCN